MLQQSDEWQFFLRCCAHGAFCRALAASPLLRQGCYVAGFSGRVTHLMWEHLGCRVCTNMRLARDNAEIVFTRLSQLSTETEDLRRAAAICCAGGAF